MARPDKAATVAEITESFRTSSAAVLTEYRGLTVAQLKTLRRSLGSNTSYAVVKNTLSKIAAREAGVEGIDDLLNGPTAIAFVQGDPVEAAKGLRDFAKAHPHLIVKGGYMDGRALTPAEIATLADLESREVLLAKLAGAMNASLAGAVSLFAAPLSQAARLVEALRAKAEQDPTVIAGAGTPAAAPAEHASDEPAEADAAADESATADTSAEEALAEADAAETPVAVAAEAPETEASAEAVPGAEG